jgi:hypothetical protein
MNCFPRVRAGVQKDNPGGTMSPSTHKKIHITPEDIAGQWPQFNPTENPKHRRGRPGEN